jgi:lipoprotein NlpI
LGRGLVHLKNDNFKKAIDDFSRSVELDPKFVRGFANRSLAYLALGRKKEAESDRAQVAALDPVALKQIDDFVKQSKFLGSK